MFFFLFSFSFGVWKKTDRPQTLLGWLESKMRLESFYIWVKLRFQHVHVWCLERGKEGGWKWITFLRRWWWGGGCLCSCSVCVWPSGSFSDGHSFSWPLPCPGRCPAGTGSRAHTAKRRDLWTRWSHGFCYLSVTLISSFCITSFAVCLMLPVFATISQIPMPPLCPMQRHNWPTWHYKLKRALDSVRDVERKNLTAAVVTLQRFAINYLFFYFYSLFQWWKITTKVQYLSTFSTELFL